MVTKVRLTLVLCTCLTIFSTSNLYSRKTNLVSMGFTPPSRVAADSNIVIFTTTAAIAPLMLTESPPLGALYNKGRVLDMIKLGEKLAVLDTKEVKTLFGTYEYLFVLRLAKTISSKENEVGWIYFGREGSNLTKPSKVQIQIIEPWKIIGTQKLKNVDNSKKRHSINTTIHWQKLSNELKEISAKIKAEKLKKWEIKKKLKTKSQHR